MTELNANSPEHVRRALLAQNTPDDPDYEPDLEQIDLDDAEPHCPACGDLMPFCQGHGEMGDPVGYAVLCAHDDDRHGLCHPRSDCREV